MRTTWIERVKGKGWTVWIEDDATGIPPDNDPVPERPFKASIGGFPQFCGNDNTDAQILEEAFERHRFLLESQHGFGRGFDTYVEYTAKVTP